MATSVKLVPSLVATLITVDSTGAELNSVVAINDKITDLVFQSDRNNTTTISGTITGMNVDLKPTFTDRLGNVDLTPEALSSFTMSEILGYRQEQRFKVTTLRIRPDVEEGVEESLHSLYIPVSAIVSVGAIVPADSSTDEDTTVVTTGSSDAGTVETVEVKSAASTADAMASTTTTTTTA